MMTMLDYQYTLEQSRNLSVDYHAMGKSKYWK